MMDEVIEAFQRKDYKTAARLLKQLAKDEPNNPWVQLYIARLHEVRQKLSEAETVYRQLLQNTTSPKIISQARQGLKRLETIEKEQRQQALSQATADPNSNQFGILILEAIDAQNKSNAAQTLAKIMQLDPYTARLQIPTRGWRLYRTGPVGELKFYALSLQKGLIPCFWVTLADIQNLNVFKVNYFDEFNARNTTIVCQNHQNQTGSLTFNWSEVSQCVEGRLPIFEQVVDLDARQKLQRKTQTLDYIQFFDLHLPNRKSILRLNDLQYQFQQGIRLSPQVESSQNGSIKKPVFSQATNRINWNSLRAFLNCQLPQIPIWSDFTSFGETAIDYKEMLSRLPSHIDLFRREHTPWDSAFQLYSGLAFLKKPQQHCFTPTTLK
ncbi:MAG TPA: cyclic nucleotide-binding protein [Cyanobacteria bacterium UBA11149]|nr:cyclic nucleotide-binding protein [Cyanobacteria bacterium UBA11367]HBE57857.1 cyclic nucleotide-binding protein [Cyanobacteria bacterium UBA11366]HBK61966.1 cyclic nucleotide-binding protein [Cyanobacteria bacterium UBA11166]HBR76533.1 cyclic nucleotide-binding protein [Cyanobacteria bacterium UBA11159]HBS67658.1 cyclic nucleotide-binding protein [Cyanobacteria bacterium UBA11153]HBW87680.1 cyclic nucleotide-binding protein [Cyanobacteria bacterium UBA11149]HCA96481.1 cyclic nucleotide-bi